jgi:hypothetical protein
MIAIPASSKGKNVERGVRCLAECHHYSGVTADFIRWLLVQDYPARYADLVRELQSRYAKDVVGQQNDQRIAGNLAQLGASFRIFAEYLSDVWPAWEAEVQRFLEEDLVTILGTMLRGARQQQESEIFLAELSELLEYRRITLDRWRPGEDHVPQVGKQEGDIKDNLVALSLRLALAEVQKSLRAQDKPLLQVTEPTLIRQLHEDGHLAGTEQDESASKQRRLDGAQARCVILKGTALGLGGNPPRVGYKG